MSFVKISFEKFAKIKNYFFTRQKYNQTIADLLFEEIKIVCLVLTYPPNHKIRALHIKNTWGRQCNKLIFLSSEADEELGAIEIPFDKEDREILWGKVRSGFKYAYEHYFDDADWFLKADDDSYFVMENLRHMLYRYRPETAIYIGHRYSVLGIHEGYHAGGGYVLSKKAVWKFVNQRMNESTCSKGPGGSEDAEMGKCLQEHAFTIDAHDLWDEKQFFPLGVEEHMKQPPPDGKLTWWYQINEWFDSPKGDLDCCSDTIANMHYVTPYEMYQLNYLIYFVHPFGLEKEQKGLPRKLTFNEIMESADVESKSPNYFHHKPYHQLDSDEIF